MKALDVPTKEMRSPAEIPRLDAFPKTCPKIRAKTKNDDGRQSESQRQRQHMKWQSQCQRETRQNKTCVMWSPAEIFNDKHRRNEGNDKSQDKDKAQYKYIDNDNDKKRSQNIQHTKTKKKAKRQRQRQRKRKREGKGKSRRQTNTIANTETIMSCHHLRMIALKIEAERTWSQHTLHSR